MSVATEGETRVSADSVVVPESVDLVGRDVVVEGFVRTCTAVSPEGVTTAAEPGVVRPRSEVLFLPMIGEQFRLSDRFGPEDSFWIGLRTSYVGPPGSSFDVDVMHGGRLRTVTVTRDEVRAEAVVTQRCEELTREALTVARTALRVQEDWKNQLVSEAHEYANDYDLCERFDEFMESQGLPRRTRDYDLRVEVTATVYLTREGQDSDAAIDSLTRADVWDVLSSGDIEWEAEID